MKGERHIGMKLIFQKFIIGWKIWVGAALIGAIVMGVMAVADYRSAGRTYDLTIQDYNDEISQLTTSKKVELLSQGMTQLEKYNVYSAAELSLAMDNFLSYSGESLKYRLNPYALDYVSCLFSTTQDPATCRDYILGGGLAHDYIADRGLAVDEEDFGELITLSEFESEDVSDDRLVFRVEIFVPDELTRSISSSALMDTVKKHSGFVGLTLEAEKSGTRYDQQLENWKSKELYIYTAARKDYELIVKNFSAVQLVMLDVLTGREVDIERIIAKPSQPRLNLKYLLIGLFIGFVLAVAVIVLKTMFEDRLQQASDITDIYGAKTFGVVDERRKKHSLVEEGVAVIVGRIELSCKRMGISRLALIGKGIAESPNVVERIRNSLKTVGIETVTFGDIISDSDSLKQVMEVGTILMAEKVGASRYSDIEKQILLINDNGGVLIGAFISE